MFWQCEGIKGKAGYRNGRYVLCVCVVGVVHNIYEPKIKFYTGKIFPFGKAPKLKFYCGALARFGGLLGFMGSKLNFTLWTFSFLGVSLTQILLRGFCPFWGPTGAFWCSGTQNQILFWVNPLMLPVRFGSNW
jgi:hypothetical protein